MHSPGTCQINRHPIVLAADVTPTMHRSGYRAGNEVLIGPLDCLVNNAGSGKWAPVHETDDLCSMR